jgi:hypothetical protein
VSRVSTVPEKYPENQEKNEENQFFIFQKAPPATFNDLIYLRICAAPENFHEPGPATL